MFKKPFLGSEPVGSSSHSKVSSGQFPPYGTAAVQFSWFQSSSADFEYYALDATQGNGFLVPTCKINGWIPKKHGPNTQRTF